jgi:hypothetical protein
MHQQAPCPAEVLDRVENRADLARMRRPGFSLDVCAYVIRKRLMSVARTHGQPKRDQSQMAPCAVLRILCIRGRRHWPPRGLRPVAPILRIRVGGRMTGFRRRILGGAVLALAVTLPAPVEAQSSPG